MEFNNSMDMLEESMFFEARNARVPCNVIKEVQFCASTSSTQYYSARIFNVTKNVKEMGLSEVDSAIEASKDHWTKLEPENCIAIDLSAKPSNTVSTLDDSTSVSDSEWVSKTEGEATNVNPALYKENLAFIENLQKDDPISGFFEIDGVDGEWVMETIIGKGGQATIYEVNQFTRWNGEQKIVPKPAVLKVFDAGYSLADLRKQWPLALLHRLTPCYENFAKGALECCMPIVNGRLLKDGRFAFEMDREWGDLRKLLDIRMQDNGNQRPPFMMPNGKYLEHCIGNLIIQIAFGMMELHTEGVLHRDLKASNVLINSTRYAEPFDPKSESILEENICCKIADFECSIGVVGTGYWRAPEILKVVKNRSWSTMPEVFTQKSDVYSYAMTCYEIITGYTPFEDIEDGMTSLEDVIEGKRPKLPQHLKPWMKELVCKCWHMDPSQRPTFGEILHVLYGNFSSFP